MPLLDVHEIYVDCEPVSPSDFASVKNWCRCRNSWNGVRALALVKPGWKTASVPEPLRESSSLNRDYIYIYIWFIWYYMISYDIIWYYGKPPQFSCRFDNSNNSKRQQKLAYPASNPHFCWLNPGMPPIQSAFFSTWNWAPLVSGAPQRLPEECRRLPHGNNSD